MSVTVTPDQRAARTAQVRRAATRAAARYAGSAHLVFAAAFWVLFALVAVVVPLIVHRSGGHMDGGVLHAVGFSARWVAFSLAIGTTYNLAAVHLSAGGTRRSLFVGLLAGAGVAGAAYGLAYGAALLGEEALLRTLFGAWEAPVGYATGLDVGSLGAAALNALGESLAIIGYALVGAAVSAAFLGVRTLRTLVVAVLVALLTVVTVEAFTHTGTAGNAFRGWATEHVLPGGAADAIVSGLAAAVVLAGAAGWLWLRLRRLQLRPPV